MSFSGKVKNEVCRYTELSKEEALAELSAIMRVSGTLTLVAIDILVLRLLQKILPLEGLFLSF